jgi:type I restriction enzyme M protein
MRSKIEANEYKDYILGFIFYKYLSDNEIKFCKEKDFSDEEIKALKEDDAKTVKFIQDNIGYFISSEDLFGTWIKKGKDFDVSNVSDALSAFSRLISSSHKKVFDRILNTLQAGLSKLGETDASKTKAISDLIELIDEIPMNGKQDYDVLGFIYEYLISMFAANAGKKAGEFYTPHEVSLLMSEIVAEHVKDCKTIDIYDPTSGSGSLLINIGQSVAKHIANSNNVKYYAQENKENTYNLTRMNLVMRGILPANINTRNADTLDEDWPFFDEQHAYSPLYVDAVVSNPPYSQSWNPSDKEGDPRYAGFGLAPKTKADFAFLLHDLFHLKPTGIMTIVLPHGVLFRGGQEGEIRKNLIEKNHIDAIIGLPANIFFGTGIPTIIMVLKRKRENNDVLIIDASKGFVKVGKNNQLRACDIKKIADTVARRESVNKFSRLVSQQEIRDNEYNLNIPRYVDSSESEQSWDIYASMFGGIPKSEIDIFNDYWKSFNTLRAELFNDDGTPYCKLKNQNVAAIIKANKSVQKFQKNYEAAFASFYDFLKKQLLDGIASVDINKEESVLANEIFRRLDHIALVDKYSVYQSLDEEWKKTLVDLEIIQTEGFGSTKKVDPNMVIKKKDGTNHEMQEGWAGHIIPFDLVQATLLKKDGDALRDKQDKLSDIDLSLEEILDSLSPEEKESAVINEDKDAFINSEILKAIKEEFETFTKAKIAIADFDQDSFEFKLVRVKELLDEQKELKALIKKDSAALQLKTKSTIEGLSDGQVFELLEQKWIAPLMAALYQMPDSIIADFVTKVQALADKYATTYEEVAKEIVQTKSSLSELIDDLTGSDFDMKGLAEFQKLLRGDNNE